MKYTHTREEMAHFLSWSAIRIFFFEAYYNPMAGHLGQDKTLNRLMAHFY